MALRISPQVERMSVVAVDLDKHKALLAWLTHLAVHRRLPGEMRIKGVPALQGCRYAKHDVFRLIYRAAGDDDLVIWLGIVMSAGNERKPWW